MKSNIQIKFLSLDEMANARDIDWRYEHVGIDNLGFADKAKNRVFVRAGLEPQLQTLLIDHELSHLFELEGTDEDEHGIRHKKKSGFMKVFVPILGAVLGSILLPGVGTMMGGSLGGLLGGATGVGLGAGLGGVAGSSSVGKPNWLGNTIGGATAGLTAGALNGLGGLGSTTGNTSSGIGGAINDIGTTSGSHFLDIAGPGIASSASSGSSGLGSSIGALTGGSLASLFSGALGQGQSGQGGYNPTSGSKSFQTPDFSQQANNNPSYSGWSDSAFIPEMGGNYGQSGMESLTNSRGMGGQSNMPMQPGLGQAGISLSGKEMAGGFGNKQTAQNGIDQMFNISDPYGASNMSF